MAEIPGAAAPAPDIQPEKKWKVILAGLAFGLFVILAAGLIWIFSYSTNSPIGSGWFLFSFAAGLSMIVLPCTLPLAFVIVPLAMGKGPAKGLAVALAFGAGVAITLSMYGILAAVLGKALFAFTGGGGETIKNLFYAIAGLFALLFALGELGLLKVRIPSYMGAAPKFIQNRSDIFKALLLGLFLGNIGVGCPHPATPMILGQIGITGDIFYGWLLFFVHAAGRVIPLLFLAILGILGVNATKSLMAHKDSIARATAWGMVFVGAFLFTLGFFSHDWWVHSGTHTLLESVTQEERFTNIISSRLDAAPAHTHGAEEVIGKTGFFGLPLWLGNWTLAGLMIVPLLWYWLSERKRIAALSEGEERRLGTVRLRYQAAFFASFSVIVATFFIYFAPHNFMVHMANQPHMEMAAPQIMASFKMNPASPKAGEEASIVISLTDEKGAPQKGLRVDHERILHVIFIHEDFGTFAHVHPEDFADTAVIAEAVKNAAFEVKYAFPKKGRYILAVDYAHEGHHGSEQFIMDIEERVPVAIFKDFSRENVQDSYKISLRTLPQNPLSGEEVSLKYYFERDGKALKNMEAYLGAPMHLAIVSADLSTFMHTHGEIHDATGKGIHAVRPDELFGPDIEAHVVFPHPGLYRVFAETMHEGRHMLTSFFFEVGRGMEGAPAAEHSH